MSSRSTTNTVRCWRPIGCKDCGVAACTLDAPQCLSAQRRASRVKQLDHLRRETTGDRKRRVKAANRVVERTTQPRRLNGIKLSMFGHPIAVPHEMALTPESTLHDLRLLFLALFPDVWLPKNLDDLQLSINDTPLTSVNLVHDDVTICAWWPSTRHATSNSPGES